MKWSERREVERYLKRRDELKLDIRRVEGGNFDATIGGRYQKDAMHERHATALRKALLDHCKSLLADCDSTLASHGITIEDDEQEP